MTQYGFEAQRQQTKVHNDQHINETIDAMQRAGQAINISTVAKATKLHRDTIKARPDAYQRIIVIREEQANQPPIEHANRRDAARWKDMEARWKSAMAQVAELQDESKALRRQLEKQLSGIRPEDQTELEKAQTEILGLEAELVDLEQTHDQQQEILQDKEVQAEVAHQLNRAYVAWHNSLPQQVKDENPFVRPKA